MGLLRAIFRMDRIGIVSVCTVRCPRAVWVVALTLSARSGCEIFLKDMSWLLAWIQG